jgi:small subunit ribosomal protein S2
MANIHMKELLEAGVHFGHQTRRWNPKMKPYIFGSRNGIHIIDLQKTVNLFGTAYEFIVRTVSEGYSVLFIGTKKQAHEAIVEESERCGMFFVVNRWHGSINRYTKKEALKMEKELLKLEKNLGGIKDMDQLPGAVFVVDPKKETIAVKEAKKLGIPVVAIADSNCDPDDIDYIIPGNDDAIRAVRLICSRISDACVEGHNLAEERLKAEAEKAPEEPAEGQEEEAVPTDKEEKGPEVVFVSKKVDGETEEHIVEES